MAHSITFQGRTFIVYQEHEGGMYLVRYMHDGLNIVGRVGTRDITKLPRALETQSGAMNGTQLIPYGQSRP